MQNLNPLTNFIVALNDYIQSAEHALVQKGEDIRLVCELDGAYAIMCDSNVVEWADYYDRLVITTEWQYRRYPHRVRPDLVRRMCRNARIARRPIAQTICWKCFNDLCDSSAYLHSHRGLFNGRVYDVEPATITEWSYIQQTASILSCDYCGEARALGHRIVIRVTDPA